MGFFSAGTWYTSRGTLSPSLFALSIEPLAELIRSNPLIQEILAEGNNQQKSALFAGDILLFLENPTTSIPGLLHNLNEYSKVSGYKVNTNKSEAMIVGDWSSQLDDLVYFRNPIRDSEILVLVTTKNGIPGKSKQFTGRCI